MYHSCTDMSSSCSCSYWLRFMLRFNFVCFFTHFLLVGSSFESTIAANYLDRLVFDSIMTYYTLYSRVVVSVLNVSVSRRFFGTSHLGLEG